MAASDVSVLSMDDGMFEVKATAGDTNLGGEYVDGINSSLPSSKAEFEDLIMNRFRNCTGPVEMCLCEGGIDNRNVDAVVLAGCLARTVIVQKIIQACFNGKEPKSPIWMKW